LRPFIFWALFLSSWAFSNQGVLGQCSAGVTTSEPQAALSTQIAVSSAAIIESTMPRVSESSVETWGPALQDLFPRYTSGSDYFAEQFRVLAHVQPAAEHLFEMLLTLKGRNGIPQRYVELAIIVASHLNRCHYCVEGHTPRLQVEGLLIEDPQQLVDGTSSASLSDTDKLVVEYTAAVTQSAERLPESLFERLREVFSESQIVELTLRITLCGFFNRFNQALQIGESSTAAHAV
jgi:uncharacterized peroxidase-related enzyme